MGDVYDHFNNSKNLHFDNEKDIYTNSENYEESCYFYSNDYSNDTSYK